MKKLTLFLLLVLFFTALDGKAYSFTDSTSLNKGEDDADTGNWKGLKECEFNAWSVNTVFNLPVLRFNINSLKGNREPLGSVEYFNSVGAGFAFSFGKFNVKTDEPDLLNTLERERTITMKNIFGMSFGFLFSKSDSIGGTNARLVFTPNVCLQILDFQIGYGYELGTVADPYHRSVITLSYGIPLSKFTDTGSYLFKRKLKRGSKTADIKGFF